MQPIQAGLCGDCIHRQIVETTRSSFLLCRRAFSDPAYRKYPTLPVVACPGYEPTGGSDRQGRGAAESAGADGVKSKGGDKLTE